MPPLPRILVTAGPTCEDIDAVRYLTNRSTGRMGIEIAAAAARRDWPTRLLLGHTPLEPPPGVKTERFRSAAQLCAAVLAALPETDLLVMTAAVADYTPAEPVAGKVAKQDGDWLLRLVRTRDILREVAASPLRPALTVIGFSLGAELDLAAARRKLVAKKLDAIVANGAASFGAATIDAVLITPQQETPLGPLGKADLAERLLDFAARSSRD